MLTSRRLARTAAATLTALALAAGGTAALAPAANAGVAHDPQGKITINVPNREMTSGCRYYVYTFTVHALANQHWNLDVDASANGGGSGSDFQYGYGPLTKNGSVYLCGTVDGPGKYTYYATLTTDELMDDTYTTVLDPGGTYQTGTTNYMWARTKTTIVTSHKKFSTKKASKKHPHTYTVKGYVSAYNQLAYSDGSRKSIRIQYKKAGTSTYKTLKTISIKDSTRVFTTKVKLTKGGRLRAVFLGDAVAKSSTSASKAAK